MTIKIEFPFVGGVKYSQTHTHTYEHTYEHTYLKRKYKTIIFLKDK